MNPLLVRSRLRLTGILFLGLSVLPGVRAANWPQFRGPTGLGYTEATNLPLQWGGPTRENVLWQSPLKGQGHASPIVWNDTVIVCTAYWPPDAGAHEKVIPEHHVLGYRVSDGKLQWDTSVQPGSWLRTDFRSGPGGGYAAPTPTTDGELIFCAFGSSVLAALDFQGRIIWRKEIIPHTFDVTLGSSPVLYQDTVILLCAMAKSSDSRVVAFDKVTGAVKWQRSFPDMAFGHSTPLIIDVNSQPQMLLLASGGSPKDNALRSVDPNDGKPLWWCGGAGDAASPAYAAGMVYFDSGRGGPGIAVDATGTGDVSAAHIRWTIPKCLRESVRRSLSARACIVFTIHPSSNVGIWRPAKPCMPSDWKGFPPLGQVPSPIPRGESILPMRAKVTCSRPVRNSGCWR